MTSQRSMNVVGCCALVLCGSLGCSKAGLDPGRTAITAPHRPEPGPRIRRNVLPIPADMVAIQLNLVTARRMSLFKKAGRKITAALAKTWSGSPLARRLLERCGVDPMTAVTQLTVGFGLGGGGGARDFILVLRGAFTPGEILNCAEQALVDEGASTATIRLAGLDALSFRLKQRSLVALALDSKRLVIASGPLRARVRDVLLGREKSISEAAVRRELQGKLRPDTAFGVLLARPTGRLGSSSLPGPLADIRSLGLAVNLPDSGLALHGVVRFGSPEKAQQLAALLPLALSTLMSKFSELGDLSQSLDVRTDKHDKGWVYVKFTLDAKRFQKLQAMLGRVLGSTG